MKSSDYNRNYISLLLGVKFNGHFFIFSQDQLKGFVHIPNDVDFGQVLVKVDHDHLVLVQRFEEKRTVSYIEDDLAHKNAWMVRICDGHILEISVLLAVIDDVLRSAEYSVIHCQRAHFPKQRHS